MESRILGINEESVGMNNMDLDKAIERVDKSLMYEDLSTIIICPTRGVFPTRVVQSWMKLMKPINQNVAGPIFAESMEVGNAYNALIKYILNSPYLSKFKYILTVEEDNLPPADGLIKLYKGMKEYDVVGGLYWGKGENGFPMIFGDYEKPEDNTPQKPIRESLQRCNALGMGFNLFKLDMFRQIEGPWFKTVQEVDSNGNPVLMTQDFYFYKKAIAAGYKIACDTSILVGHYDLKEDKVY